MADIEDLYPDEYGEDFPCPKCDGWGYIDCHCGGDLCVCTNYGERACPVCGGDGNVTEARYEQYQTAQREWWAAYQASVSARQRRFDEAAPWKLPKPTNTPKRQGQGGTEAEVAQCLITSTSPQNPPTSWNGR